MKITGTTILRRSIGDPSMCYFYEGDLVLVSDNGKTYTPTTFVTDEATIPRIFWSIPGFGPDDWLEAAILHDWCYVEHKRNPAFEVTRKEADDLLYEGIVSSGYSRFVAFVAWAAVRVFGARTFAGPLMYPEAEQAQSR